MRYYPPKDILNLMAKMFGHCGLYRGDASSALYYFCFVPNKSRHTLIYYHPEYILKPWRIWLYDQGDASMLSGLVPLDQESLKHLCCTPRRTYRDSLVNTLRRLWLILRAYNT